MNSSSVESLIRWLGGFLAFIALAIVLYGVWRGTQRKVGRMVGKGEGALRSFWFYLASSAFFFGVSYIGWIPLPWIPSSHTRIWMLFLGSLFYFPSMAFTLWARLVLGKNYFVSTGLSAQLFVGHQLVTGGPFAIVRHPMYVGLAWAAIGALLIYFTWTTLIFAVFAPMLTIRARREDEALGAEFGEKWLEYCRQVPAFVPRLRKGG